MSDDQFREETEINSVTAIFDTDMLTGGRGALQVQRVTRVFKGDRQIAKEFHRHVLEVGDDIANEDERVQNLAAVAWTDPKVVTLAEHESAKRGKRIAELQGINQNLATRIAELENQLASNAGDGEFAQAKSDLAIAIVERDAATAQLATVTAHNATLQKLVAAQDVPAKGEAQ